MKIIKIFGLILVCMLWITACKSSDFSVMSNFTVTTIDVQENNFLMEGCLHGSIIVVDNYSCRIEDDNMYIKVNMRNAKGSADKNDSASAEKDTSEVKKYLGIYYEQPISKDIEKIFIEDSENQIMIWNKLQGYGVFETEDIWKAELKNLSN